MGFSTDSKQIQNGRRQPMTGILELFARVVIAVRLLRLGTMDKSVKVRIQRPMVQC